MAMQEINDQDMRLKIQALADNELPEEEIEPVLDAIQGSYGYREEYAALLRLKRQLSGLAVQDPADDWVAQAERRITRKLGRGFGNTLFIGSYVALLGVAIVSLFRDPEVPLVVSILVGVGVLGFVALLATAIADRVRESRTDKYKGVIR